MALANPPTQRLIKLWIELDAIDNAVESEELQTFGTAVEQTAPESMTQNVGNVAEAVGNVAQAVGNVAQAVNSVAELATT